MRKQCVVVVSLFIGLCSGFIVPSGVTEVIHNGTINAPNITKENSSEKYLEQFSNINETELYENGGVKNNVSERSFIYLNQRFKKPFRNQLHKTMIPELVQPEKSADTMPQISYMPQIPYMNAPQGLPLISQKLLFVPNGIISEQSYGPPHVPNNRYQHPKPPTNENINANIQNNEATRVRLNLNLINEKTTFQPNLDTRARENIEDRYQPYKENIKLEPVDKQYNKNYEVNPSSIVGVKPGYYNKNIQFTSYTQRKPMDHQNNNIYKGNEFHRATKRYENNAQENDFKHNIRGPFLDPHSNADYDDKFVRYVKEALAENEIHLKDELKKQNYEYCNKMQNDGEGIEKNDTVESTNLEDAIRKLITLKI